MLMQLVLRLSKQPLTDNDIVAIAGYNPGLRFERSNAGELLVSPPTGGFSGEAEAELIRQLGAWNRKTGRGHVFSSNTGFNLPNQALRSPDASWVSREHWERISEEERTKFPHLCPDAVFELRSATDEIKRTQAKMLEFIENGSRLGVLIDPYRSVVEIYRPNATPHVREAGSIALDPELPGFVLDARTIIAQANPRKRY